jgi:RNA polymerase sigma-70 factor (ECF subfamily)
MIRAGDKEIYAEIIRRYQKKLLRYAGNLVGDDHIAADVVQEGFIKTYINLNSVDTKKKFSSWLYRIVHNEAMNVIGKRKYRPLPFDDAIDPDSGINIENDLIKNQLIHHTHNCMENMQLKYKEPLSLFFLEEKSYEEISDILRIPINTVGTRINRAKLIMKKICQKQQK